MSTVLLTEVQVLESKLLEAQEKAIEYNQRNVPLCSTPPISTAATKESLYAQGVQNALQAFSVEVLNNARNTRTSTEFYGTVMNFVRMYDFKLPEDTETRVSVEASMRRVREGILSALDSRALDKLDITVLL